MMVLTAFIMSSMRDLEEGKGQRRTNLGRRAGGIYQRGISEMLCEERVGRGVRCRHGVEGMDYND